MYNNIHLNHTMCKEVWSDSGKTTIAKALKLLTIMKLLLIMIFGFYMHTSASVYSQEISMNVRDVSLETALKEIRKQSGYSFFLSAELLKKAKPVSIETNKLSLQNTLDIVFKDQPLVYKIDGKSIIIQPKPNLLKTSSSLSESSIQDIIGGRVSSDSLGTYIIGATVKSLPSGTTTMTDEKGIFRIDLVPGDKKLTVSYIGMETQTLEIKGRNFFEIRMRPSQINMEDIVVTGLFNKNKESFTGASQSFTGEQLKSIAPTNVLDAIIMLTPGMVAVEQKSAGSNPNRLPDILVRGVTSFSNTDQSINQPLIVRDGTIVTLQDLYDMDINEIETVTVLKDASAAALYGAKAANGVIVIERKRISEGKLRVTYNLTSSIQMPDFSDYKLLNPMQKLEYERLAGLYTASQPSGQYALDSLYNIRYKDVRSGVRTDWMAQPSRVGITHDHSVRLAGGSQGTRYEFNSRFGNMKGVMKGDARDRYGFGFVLEHFAPHGLSFTNRITYSRVNNVQSPYGSFSNYTRMNPYEPIYDEYGSIRQMLSWDIANPLYEAKLGSYNKGWTQLISDDFDARWNINENFRVTSHWNISLNQTNTEIFSSPLSALYRNEIDLSKRGSLSELNSKAFNYSGNLVFSYNKIFNNENLLTVNAGGTISRSDIKNSSFRGIGFYADNLAFMKFAARYPDGEKPNGTQDLNSDVTGFLNLNYSLKNKYYIDGIYQTSGSSKFGANNRFGQFWSTGIGWNIHNENFINSEVVNILKIRGSAGYTGKVNFSSYQALTTYQYQNDLAYLNGIGAIPITIGNPDLKWERTMNYNVGLDVSFWDRRVNLIADLYLRKTTDLLIDKSVAPSTGVLTGKENLGEMENKGIEVRADAYAIRNNVWSWQIGANLSHNKNKILKISNALHKQNEQNNAMDASIPLPQFVEGESTTALKVVQSGGIDAATGQEIFIKRNGERTFIYSPIDKITVGDQFPKVYGNIFTNLRYKQVSVAAYFGLTTGGYIYNTTRANKIEGSDPKYNADKRVFEDRWKQPGDITKYRDIADSSLPKVTSRFVEKENTFTLDRLNVAYDFSNHVAKKIGASKLSFVVSMNDVFRISSVRMERGTSYLYSRGVDFNINVVF